MLWLGCWLNGGLVPCLGYWQQLRQTPGGRWPADSHVFGSANYFKRRLPLILSAATLPLVHWLPKEDITFRCIVSLASAFYAIKAAETVLEDRFQDEPLLYRVVGVIGTFHDVQERQPGHHWILPRLSQVARQSFKLAFHAVGCVFSMWAVNNRADIALSFSHSIIPTSTASTGIACVSGCLYAFFSLHCYGDMLALTWLLLGGFTLPSLMDEPERSLSVRQFWSRWDVVIQKLLRRNVYEPLRRAGYSSHLAICATFFMSGIIHVYPIFVGLEGDWHAAASMLSYFMIQFCFILLERPLGVESWDSTNAFVWTLVCLFSPSYILVSPVFKLLGAPGP